jgi:hypothetical protein
MKPIIIVAIRSNINWLEMDKKKFFAQGKTPITRNIFMPGGNWLNKHWKYIRIWNSVLKQNYFSVRNKLQKFAEKTHSNIKNLDIVIKGKDSIFNFIKKYKNDKWIILPIDDDDFFNPTIANKVIENYESHICDIMTWKTVMFNVSKTKLINHNGVFPSNSYMISNRVSKKVPNDVLNEMISRHASIKKKMLAYNLNHFEIGYDLALYNKSPVSFSGTRNKEINKDNISEYFSSVREELKSIDDNGFNWVRPYANGVQKILKGCFYDD